MQNRQDESPGWVFAQDGSDWVICDFSWENKRSDAYETLIRGVTICGFL